MKTTNIILTTLLSITVVVFYSCKKEGTGGKASITGYVKHHSKLIPNAAVYIKYGAKESPGTNPANYDASIVADGSAKYEFKELNKGDYYLFGIGYDSAIFNSVTGGTPVVIKKKTETVQAGVAVTE